MRNIMIGSVASVLLLAACGSANEESAAVSTAENVASESEPISNGTPDIEPVEAEQASVEISPSSDEPSAALKRGRIVWLQCRSCHTLKEGEGHLTGPNLYQVFGRRAGTAEGFAYSNALKESEITWDADSLKAWLEKPDQYIEGNIMAYAGLRRASDRDALMVYLMEETN